MEKINWRELDKSPDAAEKIIAMMICEATADKRWTKFLEESDSSKLEISLIINGVDVPFMDTLKWMINQFYSEVDKAAEYKLRDKLLKCTSLLTSLLGEMDDRLTEIVQETKGDKS